AMFLSKVKTASVLMLALSLFTAGAGAVAHQALVVEEVQPPVASQAASPTPQKAKASNTEKETPEAKEAVTFRGRVIDPDGKPVADAKLHLIVASWGRKPLHLQATAGKDGSFSLTDPAAQPQAFSADPAWMISTGWIVASADGYGPAVKV